MDFPPRTEPSGKPRATLRLDAASYEDIEHAAAILRAGGTVAFPTETVYGLAANALDHRAVEKIFVAKQRPHWDPLIVHICDLSMLEDLTTLPLLPIAESRSTPHQASNPLVRTARVLIHNFWPGPLTLLLPRTSMVPDAVTAGRPLVGLRLPIHPVARRLIERAGVPLAAPSANLFGHTSPTSAAHVLADLNGRIDAVLDGGPTDVGLESTVAEPTEDGVVIYRAGAIDFEAINALNNIGYVRMVQPQASTAHQESLPSPGFGLRHYAPHARLLLVGGNGEEALSRTGKSLELSLVEAIERALDQTAVIGVMLPTGWNPSRAPLVYPWGDWHDGETLARRLFAGLRELDDCGATLIVCPIPELPGIGEALRDRLQKAARSA